MKSSRSELIEPEQRDAVYRRPNGGIKRGIGSLGGKIGAKFTFQFDHHDASKITIPLSDVIV